MITMVTPLPPRQGRNQNQTQSPRMWLPPYVISLVLYDLIPIFQALGLTF